MKEDIIKLAEKAVKDFSSISLNNVFVEIKLVLRDDDPVFYITVYEKQTLDNRTFEYYTFLRDNKKKYREVLKTIKTDDFGKIKYWPYFKEHWRKNEPKPK